MTAFDDLSQLRAFVGIVECGSISAAARRLKQPQPTLSRVLRALEERCGTSLLQRDTHRMRLTPTGERMLADARILLAHAEESDERLRADQTSLSGHMRVFATIDWGQFGVTRLLSHFLQAYPKVTAELALTNRPLHLLLEGCDVGILPGRITDLSVVARPAGKFELCLAVSPALAERFRPPRKPDDLLHWPWVGLSGSQFWSAKAITLRHVRRGQETLAIAPVLVSEGVTSVREAVRFGTGISVLPEWLIRDDLQEGRIVHLLPAWRPPDLPVHVVYAAQRPLPARVRAFVEFAVGSMMKATGEYTSRPELGLF